QAVEAAVGAGYPLDAGGILLCEVDGLRDGLDDLASRIETICRENGATTLRRAQTVLERERLWAGRKGAFAAMGRLAPAYYVQDGVIPRTRLPDVLRTVSDVSKRHGLRIANVFHAGDGNLHPLVLFSDMRELERVHEAGLEILTACVEAGGSLTGEHGGGTKDYLGDPRPTDLILETTSLDGIVEHVPADLTVTVGAGTRFRELEDALARAGQMLPLDPPHGDAATIGGIVAANSSGFRRARYGGVRDLLIGTRCALVDGTVARAGGRVVKNVAGYDVNKLLIGSLGTLAVITECTFKVTPLPAATAGLRARFRRAADAYAAADLVARTPARPATLVIDGRGRDAWELVVLAEGEPAAVDRAIAIAADAASARGRA